MKGVVGAAIGFFLTGDPNWVFAGGFAAVVGHCYPIFHRFKGGKGVATATGVLLFTVPIVALIDIVIWAVLARITKTASVSSLVVMGPPRSIITTVVSCGSEPMGARCGIGRTKSRGRRVSRRFRNPPRIVL